ncbi:hypothetical protein [Actinomadura macrotermitis]|uniref:hypothetical protein n=1 Tax=Actinomadura macrotermitis TaxID=2585200 RepID=UPI001294A091|nr:hypothetical protein [Actinomadura macrotermitis]
MTVPDDLKRSLRRLREVHSQRPAGDVDSLDFADWRERMADFLDELSQRLLYEEDRQLAAAEAAAARAEAAGIRAGWRPSTAGEGR